MYIKNNEADPSKRIRPAPNAAQYQQQQFPGYAFSAFPGFPGAAQPPAYHGLHQHFSVGDPYAGQYGIAAPQAAYGTTAGGDGTNSMGTHLLLSRLARFPM